MSNFGPCFLCGVLVSTVFCQAATQSLAVKLVHLPGVWVLLKVCYWENIKKFVLNIKKGYIMGYNKKFTKVFKRKYYQEILYLSDLLKATWSEYGSPWPFCVMGYFSTEDWGRVP